MLAPFTLKLGGEYVTKLYAGSVCDALKSNCIASDDCTLNMLSADVTSRKGTEIAARPPYPIGYTVQLSLHGPVFLVM